MNHLDGKPLLRSLALALCAAGSASLPPAFAVDPPQSTAVSPTGPAEEPPIHEPYFLGWETEPAMDFGGRTLASLDAGMSRLMGSLAHADRHPILAVAWEPVLGLFTMVAQHEVNGHGSRAREYDLDPGYGASWDLSFYTDLGKEPETNEQNILLAAGGTEASGVLARRILLDLCRRDGGEASLIPLALFAKLDLPLYVLITSKPETGGGEQDAQEFTDQYEDGYDTAYYLVSRQALRNGADPSDVWNNRYEIDYADPLLEKDWRAMRSAALWSLLDPALASSLYAYVRNHIMEGEVMVRPPVLRLAQGYGLTASVRGVLGLAEVSRILEVIVILPQAAATFRVRDLDSSIDRTWGFGVGLHGLQLGRGFEASTEGDWWREPETSEAPSAGSRWNASASVDLLFRRSFGLSAKAGYKQEGFFPGTPMKSGCYVGFGLRAAF